MNITEFLQSISGCMHEVTLAKGLFVSLFLAGVVGGFTHCIVMCGPFVLSQNSNLQKLHEMALLPYHFGRITTYVVMAMLLSTVLNLAFLFLPLRSLVIAPMLMLAGIIFIVTAFPSLLKLFPWVGGIRVSLPHTWLNSGFQKLAKHRSIISQYFMGVLLGFMPCGLIISALMAAATAPTPIEAGLAMMAFGAGTLPALIGVAFGGKLLVSKYPLTMQWMKRGAMVWSGLWLFIIAGSLLI